MQDAVIAESDVLGHEHFAALADGQFTLGTAQAPALQGDGGGQLRIGQGAGRQHGVGNLDVFIGVLIAVADRVDRNALAADGGDGREIDATCVVRAVAEHDNGAERQRGRFGQDTLQRLAEAGCRCSGGQLVGLRYAFGLTAKLVKSHLEAIG